MANYTYQASDNSDLAKPFLKGFVGALAIGASLILIVAGVVKLWPDGQPNPIVRYENSPAAVNSRDTTVSDDGLIEWLNGDTFDRPTPFSDSTGEQLQGAFNSDGFGQTQNN